MACGSDIGKCGVDLPDAAAEGGLTAGSYAFRGKVGAIKADWLSGSDGHSIGSTLEVLLKGAILAVPEGRDLSRVSDGSVSVLADIRASSFLLSGDGRRPASARSRAAVTPSARSSDASIWHSGLVFLGGNKKIFGPTTKSSQKWSEGNTRLPTSFRRFR